MKITPVLQHITNPLGHTMPIWEIEDFSIPDINIDDCTVIGPYDQGNTRSSQKRLILSYDFTNEMKQQWANNIQAFNEYMKTTGYAAYSINYLWFNSLHKFEVPTSIESINILCDKPEWQMSMHLDNRNLFGVMILNLVDNPENTGTMFARYHNSDIVYTSPTKKNSGIFFMNTSEMWHAIKNMSDSNRYIFYIPVGIGT
jgi:hypothetical protein